MKNISTFSKNPTLYEGLQEEALYTKYIKHAARVYDGFCMTLEGMNMEEFKDSKWSFLNEAVRDYEIVDTTIVKSGKELTFIYFEFTEASVNWLLSSENIYDFEDEDNGAHLWDLCFYRNSEVVMASHTSLKCSYIDTGAYVEFKKLESFY